MLIDNNTLKRMYTEIETTFTVDQYINKSKLLDKFIDMCIQYDENNINEEMRAKFLKCRNAIEQVRDEFDRQNYEESYFYFRNIGKIDAFIKIIYIITKKEYSEEWYKNLIDLQILKPIDFVELNIEGINDIEQLFLEFKTRENEIVNKLITSIYKNYIPFLYSYFILNNNDICKQCEEAELDNTLYNKYLNKIFISILEIVLSQEDLINKFFITQNIHIVDYLKNITNSYIEFKQTNNIITYIPASVYNTKDIKSITTFDESNYAPKSFTEIVENEKLHKIRLTGYAGVGKTTTLKYLQNLGAEKYLKKIENGLNFYDDNEKIPVLIQLIDVKEKKSFKDIILENLGLRINNDNKDLLNYIIRKNKISLYIDGIDEIKFNIENIAEHNNAKKAFISEVQATLLSPEFDNINVIITDRDSNRNSISLNANEYTIPGLTIQDVCKFVEQNTVDFSNLNDEEKKQANNKINNIKDKLFSKTENNELKYSEEAVKKYAFNTENIKPLFLRQLLTIIYNQSLEEALPDKKTLNVKYLDTIIEREIVEKENKLAKYIVGALEKMIEQNGSEFPQGEYKILSAFFQYFSLEETKEQLQNDNLTPDTKALLNLIVRMGIMVRVDAQNYDFKYEGFIDKFVKNDDLLQSFMIN